MKLMGNSPLETSTNRFSYSHTKSHLKSQTLLKMFEIFSGSYNNSQPAAQVVGAVTNSGFSDKDEALEKREKDGEKVALGSQDNESVASEKHNVTKKDNIKGGDDNQLQMAIDELECIMNKQEDEAVRDNCSDGGLLGDFERLIVEDLGDLQQLLSDEVKDCSENAEVEEFSHDKNMIAEADEPRKVDSIMRVSVVMDSSEQVENQVQQKDKELEHNHNGVGPPHSLAGSGEVEEGEISGDSGTSKQSRDLFLEDIVESEENNIDTEKNRKDDVVTMGFKCQISSHVKEKDSKDVTLDAPNLGPGAERDTKLVGGDKESFCSFGARGDPVFYGDILEEKEREINKKRKLGGNSKEKKKRNKRKKRAEKNRMLGVKRLKLHPISKPKVVKICEHYLKGRCRKGAECSFSHDAVPLTKSKPCSHFARNSCMKGDDCPFDHQLSKYPCNNYATEGFCIRGENCFFSHKVPIKEGSPPASVISKAQLIPKPPSLPGVFHNKSNEHNVTEFVVKPPAQAPKGISFISIGKSSSPVNTLVFDNPTTDSGSPQVRNPDPSPKRILPPKLPPGISSVSSDKSSSNYSSSKNRDTLSLVPSDRPVNISVASLNDLSKLKEFDLSPKVGSGLKFGNQKDQSTSDALQGMREISMTPPVPKAPSGINFLPFGKSPQEVIRGQKQISSLSNQGGVSSISILEKGSTFQKSHNPFSISSKVPVSPLILPPCSDGIKNMSSSSQKALLSTVSFASKYKSHFRMDQSNKGPVGLSENSKVSESARSGGNLHNKPVEASTILDFILGSGGKN